MLQGLAGGHVGGQGDVLGGHVAAGRLGRVAEQVSGSAKLLGGERFEQPPRHRRRQLLEQPRLVVRGHGRQNLAHLRIGEAAQEVFLVIEGQISEHPARQGARQQAEEGHVVLVGHLDQDLRDVGRIEAGENVTENVPLLLLDQELQVRPEERSKHWQTP